LTLFRFVRLCHGLGKVPKRIHRPSLMRTGVQAPIKNPHSLFCRPSFCLFRFFRWGKSHSSNAWIGRLRSGSGKIWIRCVNETGPS
jgi:hypothetical protein